MNCDVGCNAKCKMLGGLEQKIMEVLWRISSPLKPSQIVAELADSHAYTTITTVLKRMFDKGLVTRKQKGNVYYYQSVSSKTIYASRCLDDLLGRLYDTYGYEVTIAFNRFLKSHSSLK